MNFVYIYWDEAVSIIFILYQPWQVIEELSATKEEGAYEVVRGH